MSLKILVTGGTGFVGSHVARQLLGTGYGVRLLVRDPEKARQYYRSVGAQVPELQLGDITDTAAVKSALAGCDGVVHAAASTPMQGLTKEQLFAVNVDGVRHVVDSALECGIKRIVSISSITAIFDEDATKVTANAPLIQSKMPYGQSKLQAESYLRHLQAQGAPIAIVYPGGVIGPDDPGFSDSFKALKHRIENGFRIFGDGGMQYVDVRDLAAFISAVVVSGSHGRFLLPGVFCTWTELADTVEAVSGCQLERIAAQGWKLRLIGQLVDVARRFKTIESPISAETMRYATLWPNIRNTEALDAQGLCLRSTRETFADAIAWMVSAGHLDATRCPRIAQHD